MNNKKPMMLTLFLFFTMAASFAYLSVRTLFVIFSGATWYDTLLASIFLSAEVFGLIHSINYILTLRLTLSDTKEYSRPEIKLETYPPIAIVVPSYHEPLSILRETLLCFYNLSYPNKHLYLLDDTRYDKPWDTEENKEKYRKELEELCSWIGVNLFRRKWRGAKAGIINDFLKFRKGATFEKMEFFPFQNIGHLQEEKYIAIFDADMNPFPDFFDHLVENMEGDETIAFIQTPQYYSNFEFNRVVRASGLQQVIFFEYISEGKGMKNAMFCCGSNVLIRIEALESVGGFDESSVTEDIVTSLNLHLNGWTSLYFRKVSAFGRGPEDLGAFFKQQFRWALGTIQLAKRIPIIMMQNYRKMTFSMWWEYFASSTHYLTGYFFFIMFIFPVLYIFFDTPTLFLPTTIYLFVLIPYLFSSICFVMWTLYLRNYKPYYMLSTVVISAVSFPVFMKAGFCALMGLKRSFVVTPKGECAPLPLRDLWPQILLFLTSVAAMTWGMHRIYYEGSNIVGLIGNMFWCFYNFIIIGFMMYFNNPEGEPWLKKSSSSS